MLGDYIACVGVGVGDGVVLGRWVVEVLELRDDELEVEDVLPDAVQKNHADCEGREEQGNKDSEEDCKSNWCGHCARGGVACA